VPNENKQIETPDNYQVRRSEKFVRVYSNNAAVIGTPFDFVLTFGEVIRLSEETYIEQTASVTMSPQHAKALAVVLLNNIKEYEKNMGTIPLPMSDTSESGQENPPKESAKQPAE
jgi:hypothetical protein